MTREEAQTAAKNGEKITHRFFSKDEYVTVIDDRLIDEKKYSLNWDMFWSFRSSKIWQTDWSIFKE